VLKTRLSIFWIRLTHWEYWPWYIVYIPVFIYWLWCGVKTRAIFWLTAANPGFEYGGVIGASKHGILAKIPPKYVPKGFLIKSEDSISTIEKKMAVAAIAYPIILKPDIGERGFHVELIKNLKELEAYRAINNETTLLQTYIDMPLELGIFYYRLPTEEKGVVSSIVRKDLLSVQGDGESTLRQLMTKSSRAKQQIDRLDASNKIDLAFIPENEEEFIIEPIGNHVRGTAFLNGAELISPALTKVIDDVSKEIEGFFYGRYDIRCASIDALCAGEFMIMELNGVASEPAHIYAPDYPIVKGYRELIYHWKILYRISRMNHRSGTPYMSFSTGWEAIRKSRFNR
jgi:hypothetical protein